MEPIDEEAEFDIGFEVNGSETDVADDVEVSINGGTDTTGTQEGDEATPANKGGRKKRRLTSSVWNHFRILPQKPNEKLHCECKKCGKKYLAGSENGTGNLIRHIKSCVKMTTTDIGQFLIVSDKDATCLGTRNPHFSQEKFRELVVHAMIRHDMPFSFVEYEGIWNIFKYLEPKAVEFTRNTAKSDITKMYAKECGRLRAELLVCPSKIALTSDAWTSIVTDGYLSLTAHFIDANWKLQKRILNFSCMPPPHTGQALSEKIYSLVCSWGIEKKLFSITLDNASANDACVDIMKNQMMLNNALVYKGELFHVRCSAHILNLVVQDGLKEIDESVIKIRECVKFVKGSSSRKQKFELSIAQTSLDSKRGLKQDVPTRWNSTYKMLSSALYYRRAFEHLQWADMNFKCCPTSDEWERVEKICGFLKSFYDAANTFSGTLYSTTNMYLPKVFPIQQKLQEAISSSDSYLERIAKNMVDKFDKYWSNFNLLLSLVAVFDPRYKFRFVEFCYGKLYGPSSQQLADFKAALFALYDEYLLASPSNQASSSCSSGSNNEHRRETEGSHTSTLMMEFDEFESAEFDSSGKQTQLEMYLADPKHNRTDKINVLDFWKSQQYRYPDLARLARDILCVPVSTVASESAFSLGGRILDIVANDSRYCRSIDLISRLVIWTQRIG